MLKRIKQVKVLNFAAENLRPKTTKEKKALTAAEGVRDAFGHLLTMENNLDLQNILKFPITEVPLLLAHADGTPTKTEKANLTRILEKKLDVNHSKPPILHETLLVDGGLLLHEVLPRDSSS